MDFPLPNRQPKIETHKEETKLIDDDIMFIMRDKLKPKSFHDPVVIQFIMAYLDCRDVTKAGNQVGLSRSHASSMRRRKDVSECITTITNECLLASGIDPMEVVERVKEMAFVDPASLINPETGAAIENLHDIPLESRRAIKKMKVKNLYEQDINGMPVVIGKLVEFEFWDKLKASDMLGAEVGKFKQTVVHEVGPTKDMREILLGGLDKARQRVKALEEGVIDVTPESGDNEK